MIPNGYEITSKNKFGNQNIQIYNFGWGLKKNREIAWTNQNFACFGSKTCFLRWFHNRSVSFLHQETYEYVKTIKKRCLEAKNYILFRKNEFKKNNMGYLNPLQGRTVEEGWTR